MRSSSDKSELLLEAMQCTNTGEVVFSKTYVKRNTTGFYFDSQKIVLRFIHFDREIMKGSQELRMPSVCRFHCCMKASWQIYLRAKRLGNPGTLLPLSFGRPFRFHRRFPIMADISLLSAHDRRETAAALRREGRLACVVCVPPYIECGDVRSVCVFVSWVYTLPGCLRLQN